jgi:hypothetical protein
VASDGFTTVHHARDQAEAAMLAGALRAEAIDARVVQVNAPLLGAAPHLFPVKIDVPSELAARARELLGELGHPGTVEDASMPPPDAEPTGRSPWPAGIGLLLPGGGHFYARLPWTAIGIEVAMLVCLVTLTLDREGQFVADLLYTALFALPLCDAAGAYFSVRASNRGAARAGRPRQLARAAALAGLAAALGGVVASVASIPTWLREARLGRIALRCSDRELVVRNDAKQAHFLYIRDIGIASADLPRYGLYRAGSVPANLRLAPGEQASLSFKPPAALMITCDDPAARRPRDCEVGFRVTVQDVETPNAQPIEAQGHCLPPWKGGGAFAPGALKLLRLAN